MLVYDFFLSLFYKHKCKSYREFWRLRKIYKNKKKRFICDLTAHKQDVISRTMGVERIVLPLDNGYHAVYCMYEVDKFIQRYRAVGIKYDLIGYQGMKPIRSCTFKEFINLYGLIYK